MVINKISEAELGPYDQFEKVDIVRDDPETTAFKQRARLHQSQWREKRKLNPGMEPMRPSKSRTSRKIGSRIALDSARQSGVNFISETAKKAADDRVARKESHQMLNEDRLYSDLLSSMPMFFNLFGPLHSDWSLLIRLSRLGGLIHRERFALFVLNGRPAAESKANFLITAALSMSLLN
jgi:hypothetical protein